MTTNLPLLGEKVLKFGMSLFAYVVSASVESYELEIVVLPKRNFSLSTATNQKKKKNYAD